MTMYMAVKAKEAIEVSEPAPLMPEPVKREEKKQKPKPVVEPSNLTSILEEWGDE